MTRFSLLALPILTACASSPRPPPAAPPPLAAPLVPLGWLAGRWERADGRGLEHWTPAGDALVGVGFTTAGERTRGFEVIIISEVEGRLQYTAMPGGAAPVG